jgi:hypothetical protein
MMSFLFQRSTQVLTLTLFCLLPYLACGHFCSSNKLVRDKLTIHIHSSISTIHPFATTKQWSHGRAQFGFINTSRMFETPEFDTSPVSLRHEKIKICEPYIYIREVIINIWMAQQIHSL